MHTEVAYFANVASYLGDVAWWLCVPIKGNETENLWSVHTVIGFLDVYVS